jgi:hypothetical protein
VLEHKIRQTKDSFDTLNQSQQRKTVDSSRSEATVLFDENLESFQSTATPDVWRFTGFGSDGFLDSSRDPNRCGLKNELPSGYDSQIAYADLSDKLAQTEKLKIHLDEVERLTSRVRDSISLDLSNARNFSPFLQEFYLKKLELVKSIQSTYNVECKSAASNSIWENCFRNQSVHNPEYVDIDVFDNQIGDNEVDSITSQANMLRGQQRGNSFDASGRPNRDFTMMCAANVTNMTFTNDANETVYSKPTICDSQTYV